MPASKMQTTVLLAGDTFDTETPAAQVRRQAFAEMAHDPAIRWVILPGNHDSLQASQLWTTLNAEAPENVVLAVEPRPIELDWKACRPVARAMHHTVAPAEI